MAIGSDHKMPRIVREGVEDNEAVFPPVEDKPFLVVVFIGKIAENAAFLLFRDLDIGHTPGSKNVFHKTIPSKMFHVKHFVIFFSMFP
jgi:hypothetical protein